jgi:hypothetical protein
LQYVTIFPTTRQITNPIKITATITSGISNGLITHHHDQLITLSNLNTIKQIVNKPKKPTPPLVVDDALLELLDIFTPYN